MKEEGLKILAAARDATGLAVVTEVIATEDIPLVARYADVMQIGARNMQNYRLLEAVGESGKPVLLKRGPSATLDELLLAAEYILNAGNPNVMLCERGIRTFEAAHTAIRCRWPRFRGCTSGRICRWWSIRATARATRAWWRRWPPPP